MYILAILHNFSWFCRHSCIVHLDSYLQMKLLMSILVGFFFQIKLSSGNFRKCWNAFSNFVEEFVFRNKFVQSSKHWKTLSLIFGNEIFPVEIIFVPYLNRGIPLCIVHTVEIHPLLFFYFTHRLILKYFIIPMNFGRKLKFF